MYLPPGCTREGNVRVARGDQLADLVSLGCRGRVCGGRKRVTKGETFFSGVHKRGGGEDYKKKQ